MAPDFKSYLASRVLSDQTTVSYRVVARVFKVHVNAAKCMLHEFYEKEKKKNASSVYATYIISGIKKQSNTTTVNGKNQSYDDDEPMPSSPPPFTSSMLEPSQRSEVANMVTSVSTRTITLVREEAFENAKKQYDTITSIHIYSVSPGQLPDLVALTDSSRELYAQYFAKQDPLEHNKTFGIIQNTEVRRRKGKRPVIPDAPITKPTTKKEEVKVTAPKAAAAQKDTKPVPSKDDSRPSSRDSTSTAQSNKPSLKRDGSSLFKAFAKQSAKPKLDRKDTDASTNASASGTEDTKMVDADEEGESEDEAMFLDTKTRKPATKKRSSDVQKERDERAAKLRKMMESDEEEGAVTTPNSNAKKAEVGEVAHSAGNKGEPDKAQQSEPQREKEAVEWSASDSEKKKDEPSAPKRKRMRRQVRKKRTMKDEDGYLVTKEEPVWESYSEDEEPARPSETSKPKNAFGSMKSQQTQRSAPASSTASAKGGAKKKGGDIMSFFGKK